MTMKRIYLGVVLVLFSILLVACDTQEVVCTTVTTTIATITTTTSTETTNITSEVTTPQEYYNGIPINNEDDCDDLITNLVANNIFESNNEFEHTIDEINALANIECLRKIDDNFYYSIHKTVDNVYVYYLYEAIDDVLDVKYRCRYSRDVSFYDLKSLLEERATIDSTRDFYPDLITNMSSSQGTISGQIYLFNGDVYLLTFYWSIQDQGYILQTIQVYFARNDNPIFSILLEKDLPSNLIHD